MKVSTKSTIFLIFTIIGLIFQVVIFSCPGWFVFRFPVSIDDYPSGWQPRVNNPTFRLYRTYKYASAGLWYFVACIESHDEIFRDYTNGKHHFKECFHSTFENAEDNKYDLPEEAYPLIDIYDKVGVAGPLGLLEFRIEACLGLLLSAIGILFLSIYKAKGCQVRGVGLTAFFSLTIAGSLFWAAVGKSATTTVLAYSLFDANNWDTDGVPVPYALIIGMFGATFTLIGAIGLLYILTRNGRIQMEEGKCEKYQVKGSTVPYQHMQTNSINI